MPGFSSLRGQARNYTARTQISSRLRERKIVLSIAYDRLDRFTVSVIAEKPESKISRLSIGSDDGGPYPKESQIERSDLLAVYYSFH